MTFNEFDEPDEWELWKRKNVYKIVLFLVISIFVVIGSVMIIMPYYNVWEQRMTGKAELSRAEYSRQIAVVEAEAKMVSAEKLAEAEVARAKGVAQANLIIGDSLKGNEDYLRYLYINGLTENPSAREIIYIPTEAGIPILEAGKTGAVK